MAVPTRFTASLVGAPRFTVRIVLDHASLVLYRASHNLLLALPQATVHHQPRSNLDQCDNDTYLSCPPKRPCRPESTLFCTAHNSLLASYRSAPYITCCCCPCPTQCLPQSSFGLQPVSNRQPCMVDIQAVTRHLPHPFLRKLRSAISHVSCHASHDQLPASPYYAVHDQLSTLAFDIV